MNKNDLLNMLLEGTVDVKFTKSDGTVRVMKATLKDQGINKSATDILLNHTNIPVFDTGLNEWRSFRWDSLKEVNGNSVNL